MQRITQEDLLLYLYGETSNEETMAIKAALQSDWNLMEQYQLLVSAKQQLEPVTVAPRSKTLDFILSYAEKQVKELTGH